MIVVDLKGIEGSGASKLVQIIRRIGHNVDVDVRLATITSAPPSLKAKVDGMKIELDKEDLIVSEHLTKHKRTIKLTSSSVIDSMTANGNGPHMHDIERLDIEGELEFTDELKEGDRVIVLEIQEGQMYVILDKAVSY